MIAIPMRLAKRSPMRPGFAGWFLAIAALCLIVAHGCHGDDFDHEPSVSIQPSQNERTP